MIEIHKSGLYTSIQNRGRYNYSHLGVPISGAMDSISAGTSNRLLDNDPNESVIECTITGPEFMFTKPTSIAISGAIIQPFINGIPSFINTVLKIESGDILTFGKIVKGARFYIAIRGGFLDLKC